MVITTPSVIFTTCNFDMPQWKSSISIDSFATESTRIEIFLLLYLFISYIQEYPFWLLEFLLKWSSTFMTKSGSRRAKSFAATLRLRTSTFQYQNSPFVCLCIEIVLNVFIGRDKQPFTQWTTPTTFVELTAFGSATTLSRIDSATKNTRMLATLNSYGFTELYE